MATVFEITVLDEDVTYAEQAVHAAFDELDIIESQLSRFIENSDISRINNLRAHEKLKLGFHAFDCLALASRLHEETGGVFDCTLGRVTDFWMNKKSSTLETRLHTGMNLIELDPDEGAVTLKSSPVSLDLGGIGKGYAIDRMTELLDEWSIDTALVHGGRSAVAAIGAPESTSGWKMSMSHPKRPEKVLATISLRDRAMSASGLQKGAHIINPFTTRPADSVLATWVVSDTSAMSDALSTAFMIMPREAVEHYCLERPGLSAMIMQKDSDGVLFFGPWEKEG
jgi:thiamine biosynthesis lipoprotein